MRRTALFAGLSLALTLLISIFGRDISQAQTVLPTMLVPTLNVRAVVTGLVTPISMAFIGTNDILVLEKNTGRVQRVTDGQVRGTVLDLAVNFGAERGLLGIALHPNFASNHAVYLYWTSSTTGADT